jgi:hypothetical protein
MKRLELARQDKGVGRETLLKRKLSTVDLLILTSLAFDYANTNYNITKQAIILRRIIVLNLPLRQGWPEVVCVTL